MTGAHIFKPGDFESPNWHSANPPEPSILSQMMAERANKRLQEYLEKECPRVGGNVDTESGNIFMDEHHAIGSTHTAYLIDVRKIDE